MQNYRKTAMVVSAVGLCHIGFVSATRNRHTCSLSRVLKLGGMIHKYGQMPNQHNLTWPEEPGLTWGLYLITIES